MISQSGNEFFYELDPETVLRAIETLGVRATGRSMALNSFENRVYQVEIEIPEELKLSAYDSYRVGKFYRPGRWSEEQIREEHEFLLLLAEHEVPVVAPLTFPNGDTLQMLPDHPIRFCVYPKVGGRHRSELPDTELRTLGRLLAQVHNLGAQIQGRSRVSLSAKSYGTENVELLCESRFLPEESKLAYRSVVEPIIKHTEAKLQQVQQLRIHGDFHLGNVLWLETMPFILDFDDMLFGPAVQDLWLVNPGRDEDSKKRQEILLEGYQELRAFNPSEISLVEPLRALRILHFQGWIAKRWEDPAFPRTFEQFGTPQYWREELAALQEISDLLLAEG
ncbi:MAG: serine/threonine protein kinase [Bdellovibrionales bacterium]|nr:serine/threonine protein kinase [Bdellovibrionales bacterium]